MKPILTVVIQKTKNRHTYWQDGQETTLPDILAFLSGGDVPLIRVKTFEDGQLLLDSYIPTHDRALLEYRLKRAAKAQV